MATTTKPLPETDETMPLPDSHQTDPQDPDGPVEPDELTPEQLAEMEKAIKAEYRQRMKELRQQKRAVQQDVDGDALQEVVQIAFRNFLDAIGPAVKRMTNVNVHYKVDKETGAVTIKHNLKPVKGLAQTIQNVPAHDYLTTDGPNMMAPDSAETVAS